MSPEITPATPADLDRVVATLVAAFRADPVIRYLFPDDATYPGLSAAFFGHLFDKRLRRNAVWTIEGGASVAVWEPPGPDETHPPLPELELPPDAEARLSAYDEAVHALLPDTPFWYLGLLGTHPDHAGRRWGHALMAHGLEVAARDGVPAVLETSRPDNVEMYRRAGWEVTASSTEPVPFWVLQH